MSWLFMSFVVLIIMISSRKSFCSTELNMTQETANLTQIWQDCLFCGILKKTRIVGGRSAAIREFPWTVDIRKNGVQHCGGSVIRSRYILTAAHCVAGHDIESFTVLASVANVLNKRAFKSKVEWALYHPQFDSTIYDYDVAVLKLLRTIPLDRGCIRAVCLSTADDDPEGKTAVVSGWGALKEDAHDAPNDLHMLGVPIVSNEECRKAKGLVKQKITDRMLCAGYLHEAKDACSGDSGGPLVWLDKGTWKQVGIVSWGIGCARENYYGIYTRVSTLLTWIEEQTEDSHC